MALVVFEGNFEDILKAQKASQSSLITTNRNIFGFYIRGHRDGGPTARSKI